MIREVNPKSLGRGSGGQLAPQSSFVPFTLIELTFSLALVGFLSVVFVVFVNSLRGLNERLSDEYQAFLALDNTLERLPDKGGEVVIKAVFLDELKRSPGGAAGRLRPSTVYADGSLTLGVRGKKDKTLAEVTLRCGR